MSYPVSYTVQVRTSEGYSSNVTIPIEVAPEFGIDPDIESIVIEYAIAWRDKCNAIAPGATYKVFRNDKDTVQIA